MIPEVALVVVLVVVVEEVVAVLVAVIVVRAVVTGTLLIIGHSACAYLYQARAHPQKQSKLKKCTFM